MSVTDDQKKICERFRATYLAASTDSKLGLATSTLPGTPVNGLRHKPTPGTTGWYIWAGEVLSSDDDFFEPMHVAHLETRLPEVLPYLGLGPGWRFLIAPGYEDVWFDESLLEESPA